MKNKPNYAFIDSQNLNLSIKQLGWKIDMNRFFVYLKDKYRIEKAFLFIGYLPKYEAMYKSFEKFGYICIFRPTLTNKDGSTKGNCDAELVLHVMIEYENYDKANIVSGDGDFQCLARYLHKNDKLGYLLIPNQKKYSALLKFNLFKPYLRFISDLRSKLEYINKKKNPRKDKTLKGNFSIGDNKNIPQKNINHNA